MSETRVEKLEAFHTLWRKERVVMTNPLRQELLRLSDELEAESQEEAAVMDEITVLKFRGGQ